MITGKRLRSLPDMLWRRSRTIGIVFFVLLLLAISRIAEFGLLRYYEGNWDAVVEQKSEEYVWRAEQAFVALQRATRRIATEVAQHPAVLSYLSGEGENKRAVFALISRISKDYDAGVEVFDSTGTMIAWEGRSGPRHTREVQIALDGQLTSLVNPGPIYSHLFVTIPVRAEGHIIGAVIVRRTVEVNYPVSNKFINREGLSLQLSEAFGVAVEFNFSANAPLKKDGRFVSAYLHGIDSSKVGVVSVLRPSRSSFLENVSQRFARFNALLAMLLVALAAYVLIRRAFMRESLLLRSLALTAIIWLMRYTLLWLDIPSSLITSGVLDPVYFASKFGGGLAKSIGEMSLSALALLLNTLIIFGLIVGRVRRVSPWRRPGSPALRVVLATGATVLMFLLLRAYGATIRSVVFDSTLSYTDPRVNVPSFELGVMVVNLFMLSFSLIIVVVAITSLLIILFTEPGSPSIRQRSPWFIVGGLFAIAAFAFDVFQNNPLMTTWYRLLFGFCILAFTLYLHRRAAGVLLSTPRNLLYALALSTVFFYPLLNEQVHQKDREKVQMFAVEVLRPADSWLSYVVEEALQRFGDDETVDILLGGSEDEINKLAFTHWANSVASREGYNCRFSIIDARGKVLSQFSIGGQNISRTETEELQPTRSLRVREIGTGINAVKIYEGATPIFSLDERLIGWGMVVVSAGQQALFRGENPPVLRSISRETLESFYRSISVSEFRDGVLFATNNPSLPLSYRLPASIGARFADTTVTSFWAEEEIGGNRYESYFVRRTDHQDHIIALSLEHLPLSWHLFNLVKVMVYYAIVVGVLLILAGAYRWMRGVRYQFTFRDKLLAALLFTSVIPVIALALYGRVLARDRMLDALGKRLAQETATVAGNIIQRSGDPRTGQGLSITPSLAEQLANDLGIDVNVYADNMLVASSRPELYEAGILDRRLSGRAYANVVENGKRFYLERERIGLYEYVVGYAPVLDYANRILALVSVPTLYHQEDIDREVSKQNALLFGVYAVVLIVLILVATTLANRIAAPIHRLTEATKRVSEGDLDVRVTMRGVDGEIGELMTSFEKMTRDLKQSRAHLVQYERELAWKEMARQVAHEIKNPLTPMKLSLQHLRQTYADKVPDFTRIFDEVSRTIIEQIDALSRIASEFSHFARMPRARREPCDVNEVLGESMHLFDQDAGVTFTLDAAAELPVIVADREELRRAFINIIRNGIQAMGGAGHMILASRPSGRSVRISLRDFGVGMSDDVKAKLFQPNFSTKTDGMGLGLAIVKKTIDDLKGTISIESAVGEGTTVVITLPADPSESGDS